MLRTLIATVAMTSAFGALGDSITVGTGTSDPNTKNYAAVAGIPARGRPGSCLVLKSCVWNPFVSTFSSDVGVLREYGPIHTVIAEIGLNDIMVSDRSTVARMERAYRHVRLLGRARAVTVVIATLPPFGRTTSGELAANVTRARIHRWMAINRWIRSHGPYVDFARVLGQGRATLPMKYNAGDGIHPNDAGQAALGRAVKTYMANH